jgi:L-amino acid N-acyltransferase YncA
MNTITLTHTDGRDALYRLSLEPRGEYFAVVAEFGRRDVYTKRVELSANHSTRSAAKGLFDRKIAEKKKRGYKVASYT